MSKAKIILIVAFVLAVGAGVVVGMVATRTTAAVLPPPPPPPPSEGPSVIQKQLNLSDDQRKKMKDVMSEVMHGGPQQFQKYIERRHELDKERDQALMDLLSPAQRIAYDKVKLEYKQKADELDRERHAEHERQRQEVLEKTKPFLSDSQQKDFEEILRHGPPDHGGRWHGPSPNRAAASSPTTGPGSGFPFGPSGGSRDHFRDGRDGGLRSNDPPEAGPASH